MALGRRGSLASGLIVVSLATAACSRGEVAAPTTPSTTAAIVTSTVEPTPSSPTTTTTTTGVPRTTTGATTIQLDAEVEVPDGDGPFPAIVLVHGGGWVAGSPTVMRDLAAFLTDNGFLTVNTAYELSDRSVGFPAALDDVACAVRYAAEHPDADGSVAIVGHSAGAHLAAVVALTGDLYGDGCPYPGPVIPQRLIGLAGPYDVERLGVLMIPFFGGGPAVEPEAWEAGNPLRLVTENPTLSSLIMYGDEDALVSPGFAIDFQDDLVAAGSDVTLELVEGANHMDMRDPDVVGDLMLAWLDR